MHVKIKASVLIFRVLIKGEHKYNKLGKKYFYGNLYEFEH
jgi:hypothetical protein